METINLITFENNSQATDLFIEILNASKGLKTYQYNEENDSVTIDKTELETFIKTILNYQRFILKQYDDEDFNNKIKTEIDYLISLILELEGKVNSLDLIELIN